jgi:predicted dehydrogenase
MVDDTCTALLRGSGCVAELTSSWTAWRSRFSIELYGAEGFAELEGLVKYAKYGQAPERIRYGKRNPTGAPVVQRRSWSPLPDPPEGAEPVEPLSAQVECLDLEWQWLRSQLLSGTLDLDQEEERNLYIADVCERFYQ